MRMTVIRLAHRLDRAVSATYEGPAAGLYASRNIVADEADYGKFTAEAALTARFGVGSAGARIGGTVDGFADENGDSLGDWTVTLMDRKLTNIEGEGLGGIDNRVAPSTTSPTPTRGSTPQPEPAARAPAERDDETAFGGADGILRLAGSVLGQPEVGRPIRLRSPEHSTLPVLGQLSQ